MKAVVAGGGRQSLAVSYFIVYLVVWAKKVSLAAICIYVRGLGRIFYLVFEWIQSGYINY